MFLIFLGIHLKDETVISSKLSQKADPDELGKLLIALRDVASKKTSKKGIDFDNLDNQTDEEIKTMTGITKEQFNDLLTYVADIRDTPTRSKSTALGIFLVKLRTGLSHSVLATLFHLSGRNHVGKVVQSIRRSLMNTFVPANIGFDHITREDIISNHTSARAKALFANDKDDIVILVLDGTYIYIEKSAAYSFQRKTFSVHKGRPLVKPMMIVTTSGYIVDIIGPYFANGKNNDSGITTHVFNKNISNIQAWVQGLDVFIVDRGFRDCQDFLEECGIDVFFPAFLEKGQKQHTTEEANQSRLITSVRWVVEAANGRIKRWKFLSHVVPNTQIEYIGDYVKIVSGLCNKYRPDFISGDGGDEVAEQMKARVSLANHVQSRVEKGALSSRGGHWKPLNSTEVDFPVLSFADLRNITLGVYQIKQVNINEKTKTLVVENTLH